VFGFKSLTAVAAIVAAVAGGLVAYVYEGDPAPVVTVSAPESTGEDAGFVVPDEFRQRFAEGFQISPEVEAALQQRIEQGLIPEGGGFFPAPDGGFGRIAPDKPAGAN
jgi:uncharacterized membrane protein